MGLGEIVGVLMLVLAIILFKLLPDKRDKEPTLFNCARCGGQSVHTERTLIAWRNNKKPFCNECHKRWLESNTGNLPLKYTNNKGCLGFIAILIFVPCGYFITQAIYPG